MQRYGSEHKTLQRVDRVCPKYTSVAIGCGFKPSFSSLWRPGVVGNSGDSGLPVSLARTSGSHGNKQLCAVGYSKKTDSRASKRWCRSNLFNFQPTWTRTLPWIIA